MICKLPVRVPDLRRALLIIIAKIASICVYIYYIYIYIYQETIEFLIYTHKMFIDSVDDPGLTRKQRQKQV